MTGARFAFFLFFSDEFRQSCINIQITQDSLLEMEEQFSLRFIELEGTSLPDTLVLNPPTSTIQIINGIFGGCYSNSACSGNSLGPTNAEDCCVSSAGIYFSDETTCFQCIGTSFICVRVFPAEYYNCFDSMSSFIELAHNYD